MIIGNYYSIRTSRSVDKTQSQPTNNRRSPYFVETFEKRTLTQPNFVEEFFRIIKHDLCY